MSQTKTAVITGGGRGIGRAVAKAFAKEKWTLFLTARSQEELDQVSREASSLGASCHIFSADLSQTKDLEKLCGEISRFTPRIDVLVNNAGMIKVAPIPETSLDVWEKMLRVNLTAPFYLTKSLLPLLQKSSMPHVFNILSIAARVPFSGSSAYCASKAGFLGLNGVMREEFRSLGIRVTAVVPGATDTKMFDEIPGEYDRSRFVRPEDVALGILSAYQLSPKSNVDEIQITSLPGV